MPNSQSIKDRFKAYIKSKGLTTREFERKIGVANGYVGSIRNFPSPEVVSAIALSFPDFNLTWAFFGEGGMLSEVETRPEIPAYAIAGGTADLEQSITADDCQRLPVIPVFPDYDATIQVHGESMEPTFIRGEHLAIKRVYEIFEWGAPYVINSTEGVYVKRIFDNGDSLTCRSDNPDYSDLSIPKSAIRGLYRVVASFRIH